MTKDEALKLALEALESKYVVNCGAWRVQQDQAITAIKEALAQQNEFKPDWDEKLALTEEVIRLSKRIKELEAQPEQERFLVATIGNWGRVEWADGVFPSIGDKMYSAPPKWVGLTDEDLANCLTTEEYETARYWETKLKEKNT